jgi:pilus assembly protein Flp/PilA
MLDTRSHMSEAILQKDGQALVEYSLILLLIALVAVGSLTAIGGAVSGIITNVAAAL